MRANKAQKRLTKIEALMSGVAERYSPGAPDIREVLQNALAAVTRAGEAVSSQSSSGKPGRPSAGLSHPASKLKRRPTRAKRKLSSAGKKTTSTAAKKAPASVAQAPAGVAKRVRATKVARKAPAKKAGKVVRTSKKPSPRTKASTPEPAAP